MKLKDLIQKQENKLYKINSNTIDELKNNYWTTNKNKKNIILLITMLNNLCKKINTCITVETNISVDMLARYNKKIKKIINSLK